MIPLMIVKIGQKKAKALSELCGRRHNSEKAAFCIFPEAVPPTSSMNSLERRRIIVQNLSELCRVRHNSEIPLSLSLRNSRKTLLN